MPDSRRKHSTETHAVVCPATQLSAMEDWKKFVELPYFRAKWKSLKLDDEDLSALQVVLTANPKLGVVVKGTGGLRKARFAKKGGNKGKSGSYRIGYVYFEKLGVIGLIVVFAKDDQSDIPASQRALIKIAVGRLYDWVVAENKEPRSKHGQDHKQD